MGSYILGPEKHSINICYYCCYYLSSCVYGVVRGSVQRDVGPAHPRLISAQRGKQARERRGRGCLACERLRVEALFLEWSEGGLGPSAPNLLSSHPQLEPRAARSLFLSAMESRARKRSCAGCCNPADTHLSCMPGPCLDSLLG